MADKRAPEANYADVPTKKARTSKFTDGPPAATMQRIVPLAAGEAPTAPPAGYVPPSYTAAPQTGGEFVQLPVSIQNQFWHLFNSGTITQTDLDESIYKSLQDFTEDTAHEIVQGFSRADLVHVRNKTGFFIGILKQYRRQNKGLKKNQNEAQQGYAPQAYAPPPAAAQQPMYFDPYGSGIPFPPPPPAPPAIDGTDPAGLGLAPDPYAQAPVAQYDPYGIQAPQPAIDPNQQMYYDPQFSQAYAMSSANQQTMPTAAGGSADTSMLPQAVQHLFDQIFQLGMVMPNDIPTSIYDSLKDFDEDTQYSIVERFYKSDLSRVRNKTGYFIGILKQARQGKLSGYGFGSAGNANAPPAARPAGGSYASYTTSAGYTRLSSYCQQRIRELVENGQIQDGDLDHSVFDSLADFGDEDQLTMVESFCSKDLGAIRNKTAFFIGILKRHRSLKQNADILNQWA